MKNRFANIFNSKGISLIEIMLSMGILVVVLVPTISLFSASVTNNRMARESIEAKYLAEKYMEVVKATRVDALEGVLTSAPYGFVVETPLVPVPGETAYDKADEGIEIRLSPVGYSTGGAALISDAIGYLDINGVIDEITITAVDAIAVDTINLSARITSSTSPDPADIFVEDISGTLNYVDTWNEVVTAGTLKFILYFNGARNVPQQQEITIINQTAKKLEFYCVNQTATNTYSDERTLPKFIIKEGKVGFKDFTVMTSGDRLAEETNEMFLGGETFDLAYNVTISVSSENGPYILESLKAVN